MTIRHLVVIEETFRSDCATDKIPTTFETKASNLQARAFQSIDAQTTDIDEVTSSTTYIIALVKAIETLNLCKLADVDNRDRHEHSRRDSVAPFELSCFWCGGKDAFGAVEKTIHCSNAPNHLLMLKPRQHSIWLLWPKSTNLSGSSGGTDRRT